MSLSIAVVDGSGRATCAICRQKIEKGILNQVVSEGYKTSVRCHRDCITHWEKVKILEALDNA